MRHSAVVCIQHVNSITVLCILHRHVHNKTRYETIHNKIPVHTIDRLNRLSIERNFFVQVCTHLFLSAIKVHLTQPQCMYMCCCVHSPLIWFWSNNIREFSVYFFHSRSLYILPSLSLRNPTPLFPLAISALSISYKQYRPPAVWDLYCCWCFVFQNHWLRRTAIENSSAIVVDFVCL